MSTFNLTLSQTGTGLTKDRPTPASENDPAEDTENNMCSPHCAPQMKNGLSILDLMIRHLHHFYQTENLISQGLFFFFLKSVLITRY